MLNRNDNYPETPEFIHDMIQEEVQKQVRKANTATRPKRWSRGRIAVIAAASVLAVSTIAYAGANWGRLTTEKTGTYATNTAIEKTEDDLQFARLPEQIRDIDIRAEYIPAGMEWMDENHLEYPESDRRGGFSFESLLLDSGDLGSVIKDGSVMESESHTFGIHEGVYLRYNDLMQDGSFSQRIYLLCPEVHRVLKIYIGDDVSKAEAIRLAENLVISENETLIDSARLSTWSSNAAQAIPEDEIEIETSVPEGQLPVHVIGDAIPLSANGEDTAGNPIESASISARVDAIQITDDLQLLQGSIPEEWQDVLGNDGKLTKTTLSYIRSGDGIESVDEIVRTHDVDQKLVLANVTYTNNGPEEIRHLLYLGTLVLMDRTDGTYQLLDPQQASGDGFDRVIWSGPATYGTMQYCSMIDNYGDGGNYIPSIKPGDSVQIQMAWIVNENDLNKLYLSVDDQGSAYEVSEGMLNSGVVKIVQN